MNEPTKKNKEIRTKEADDLKARREYDELVNEIYEHPERFQKIKEEKVGAITLMLYEKVKV